MKAHLAGNLERAERLFTQVLEHDSGHAQALHLLGIISHQKGKNLEAIQLVSTSIRENPAEPIFYNNQGLILHELGRKDEAVKSYETAIQLRPDMPDPYNNLGNILRETDQAELSVDALSRAIKLRPDFAEAHYNLGKSFECLGDYEQAVRSYQNAVKYRPDYHKALNNLGNALRETGKMNEALSSYRRAVRIAPDYIGAYNNLGNILSVMGKFEEAVDTFKTALERDPLAAETLCNLGKVYKELCLLDQAADCYVQAINRNPGFAEAHFNHAIVLLLNGKYIQGWREYEWRSHMAGKNRPDNVQKNLPVWDGSSLKGKRLLVSDEQGLGDVIQFVRFIPLIRKAGGRFVFRTRKPLIRLLSGIPGMDEIVERSDSGRDGRIEGCDFHLPLMSLAHRFEIQPQNLHSQIPYISAEPSEIKKWQSVIGSSGFKVGIVWAGSPRHLNDQNRSCGLQDFKPLFKLPGIKWIDLQTGSDASRSGPSNLPAGSIRVGHLLKHFSHTAGVLENLDLVISVDTATAHLAGAMGKPVWTLLPFSPDWRWMMNRTDTPWYPSMKLFRQKKRGDWKGVFRAAARELSDWIANSVPVSVSCDSQKDEAAQASLDKGTRAYLKGEWVQARRYFNHTVKIDHDHFQAYFNLGRVHHDLKSYEKSISSYQAAVRIKPDLFEGYFNMGVVYQEIKDHEGAVSAYRAAIEINPEFSQSYYNLAAEYQEKDKYELAAEYYKKAALKRPDYADAFFNLGLVLLCLKKNDQAVEAFQKTIALKEDSAKAYNNLGIAYHGLGKLEDAEQAFQAAMKIKPDYVDAYHNTGNLYIDRLDMDQTIDWYKKALAFTPDEPRAFNQIGKLLQNQAYTHEAIKYFEHAVSLKPDYTDAHLNLALANLRSGHLRAGWKEYEWRFNPIFYHKIYPYQHHVPRWDGSPFPGKKVLVHSEQGLGDTIHFSRYLPMVKEKGGEVVFETVKSLQGIFKNVRGLDMVLEMPCGESIKNEIDYYVPLMSLPGLFKTEADNVPADIPYIRADELKTRQWEKTMGSEDFKVGIAWTGNPMNVDHHKRSCKPRDFRHLTHIPNVRMFSLQKGDGDERTRQDLVSMEITDLGNRLNDFTDTAAVIENLDLVISVDTVIPHLAGAMGKPVWTLLCFVPDWRWLLEQAHTPWYPTMTLFRQKKSGDWDGVFKKVRSRLCDLVGGGTGLNIKGNHE